MNDLIQSKLLDFIAEQYGPFTPEEMTAAFKKTGSIDELIEALDAVVLEPYKSIMANKQRQELLLQHATRVHDGQKKVGNQLASILSPLFGDVYADLYSIMAPSSEEDKIAQDRTIKIWNFDNAPAELVNLIPWKGLEWLAFVPETITFIFFLEEDISHLGIKCVKVKGGTLYAGFLPDTE